jgi:voltage-gated potassium channel
VIDRYAQIQRRFILAGTGLAAVLATGTIGYRLLGGESGSVLDALYMTVITISTIGYGEIIPLEGNPLGRVFTMFIALSGIGLLFYAITNLTAFVVEGELRESFWRKKMEKTAKSYRDHFIVCGIGLVGAHIVRELDATQRPYVIVEISRSNIEKLSETSQPLVLIEGDATDNSTLLKAGIDQARGLFAVTGDDNQNLVICLTAKQLNPHLRVVAECTEIKNSEKMKKAGADAVVSPSFIGGLRMASEMVRPTVVSFLDTMLRDRQRNWRVEEIPAPLSSVGKPVSTLNLGKHPSFLLLAIKTKDDLIYNPSEDHVINEDDTLVFMGTPEVRQRLEKAFRRSEPSAEPQSS